MSNKVRIIKVLPVPRGAYSAGETYAMLDIVTYNGCAWVAKKDSTGISPVEGEYWQMLVQNVDVVDSLESDSATSALSARQGKALLERIIALENK